MDPTFALDENVSMPSNELMTRTMVSRDCNFYNMNHKNQGLAYIFSHETFHFHPTRNGADVEAKRLKNCLLKLQFDVQLFRDLKVADIKYHVEQARKMDHSNNNCLVIAVMSHGDENKIEALDDFYDPKEMFWNQFNASNCPTLAGKPKLVFLSCCQGEEVDSGATMLYTSPPFKTETDGRIKSQIYTIPIYSDFCIMYATSKGHFAFRNTSHGSFFIKGLCEELEKHAYQEHLLTILTFVIRRVAVEFQSRCREPKQDKKKQIPYFESSLTRLVQFQDKNGNQSV